MVVINDVSPSDSNRNRVFLCFKRNIIEEYLNFVKAPPKIVVENSGTDLTDQDYSSSDDENSKEENQVRTIKNFLSHYNKEHPEEQKLLHGCVFKWLKSYERGELEEWDGLNPLNKSNAKAKKIMEHIYKSLKANFKNTAIYHKILRKSKLSPEKYGVYAKRPIRKGTFLGFFQGKYVAPTLLEDQSYASAVIDGFHMYRLDEFSYIDGRDFSSCFARYYACSGDISVQNVSVHRLAPNVWSDPNRAVCFMANKDIDKGQEFVIPLNQDYVVRKKHKMYGHADCSENDAIVLSEADVFVV
jgi:hypothetical protein